MKRYIKVSKAEYDAYCASVVAGDPKWVDSIPYVASPLGISGIAWQASDSKWGQPHSIPYGTASGWNVGEAPPIPTVPNWWTPACDHVFVDTGTLKSYCKHCNADAVWCSKELKFKLK